MARRIASVVLWAYLTACAIALALGAVGVFGLFGTEPDALIAIFAILLAMPWIEFLGSTQSEEPLFGYILALLASMGINAAILLAIRRLVTRRGGVRRGPDGA